LEQVFENCPPHIKDNFRILLLGGTGAGKTSFLNFLANVQRAIQSIQDVKSCKRFNNESIENYTGGDMASKTSDSKKYLFKIG